MKNSMKLFVILLVISQATACAQDKVLVKPNSRDEAAAVLISVNTVAPWDQIANAVQPNFSLTGDQALMQIAPVTARIQEQVLKSFGFGLGLGLSPGSTATLPSLPSTSQVEKPPAVADKTAEKPPAADKTGDIGLDPILKYQAALSLYQAVQLMNQEVEHAAMIDKVVPYLVTMKLAVMPYRRNLPYDIHARISFFPKFPDCESSSTAEPSSSPETPPKAISSSKNDCINAELPRVVPILVTDDIERAMKSSAAEVAKQIGLALSLMVQSVGANLSANKTNQSIKEISGQDINSRLTVSRLTDNTIYVRIGASYESTAGPALVGQTYNISLLVLIPKAYFVGKDYERKPIIQVYQHNELQDTLDGSILADRPISKFVYQADQVMQSILSGRYDEILKTWNASDDKTKERIIRALFGPVQTSRFPEFVSRLRDKGNLGGYLGKLTDDYQRNLWTRLSAMLADSAFKSAFFELPLPQPISFLTPQTALLLDDTKENAQVKLQTISGAKTSSITATINLNTKYKNGASKELQLIANTSSLDTSTGVLTLSFPSPAKWGIEKSNFDNSELVIGQRCEASNPSCPKLEGIRTFKLRYAALKADNVKTNKQSKP
jgi:hypothetical protein